MNGQLHEIARRPPNTPINVRRDRDRSGGNAATRISAARITQATTARFADLSFTNAFLVFVERGEKRVQQAGAAEQRAGAGEVLVIPSGAVATIENRTWSQQDYAATVIGYPKAVVASVFGEDAGRARSRAKLVLSFTPPYPCSLQSIQRLLCDPSLPAEVVQHRLIEPLLWLKAAGISIPTAPESSMRQRIRALIDEDLCHPWQAAEVARRLAVSEATLRRLLKRSGDSFSRLLRNSRLEHGLSLLQTTDQSITEIAYACGFATPSHFSQRFKERFRIPPRAIRLRED